MISETVGNCDSGLTCEGRPWVRCCGGGGGVQCRGRSSLRAGSWAAAAAMWSSPAVMVRRMPRQYCGDVVEVEGCDGEVRVGVTAM